MKYILLIIILMLCGCGDPANVDPPQKRCVFPVISSAQ